MLWIPYLLILNLVDVHGLTPKDAILLAEEELSDFPESEQLFSSRNPCKKVTTSSLQMSKRNALFKKAMNKLERVGKSTQDFKEEVKNLLAEKFGAQAPCSSTATSNCTTDSKYRTIDGTCNNKKHTSWGATGAPLIRLLEARYGNAASTPKTKGLFTPSDANCAQPGNLPNSRHVSTTFHPDSDVPSTLATHMVTQFGQYLDHDLSLTPENHVFNCCGDNSKDECSAISIPSNDPFYSTVGITCLEFTRSQQYCDSSPRQQFNAIASYVDASNVYGSDSARLAILRDSNKYLLKTTKTATGKELLPTNDFYVYIAGDPRAVVIPELTAIHTLFVREHNRIAKEILETFPSMDKETIFQEARRILGAENQNVVFDQYLASLFSHKYLDRYRLRITSRSTYDPTVNADISNAFATAAYRFGHSMIRGNSRRAALTPGGSNTSFSRKDAYFRMAHYEAKDGLGLEELLLGLLDQPSQANDNFAVDDLTNHLFNGGRSFGSDLFARNIQRGRDHGLPTYGFWRQHCDLQPVCDWNTKPDNIKQSNWNILKTLYKSPNDIDLFTAGLAENSSDGSVLGDTFSCILGKQFENLKYGDRYFFTHSNQIGSFTDSQIQNIRTRNLGQIICDNTDIKRVKANVFKLNSDWITCPNVSTLNVKTFIQSTS
ncbi:salivary peroxidase/catechol oxidase [Lepeophtheirus salmonis]|uniref:salivary peroxidase/catechol oxidase n=1 Tax=Lepeophtheirus salmonis TaxID=72036 RepID=UPI001AEA003F|nr:peroxidasin homolog [Lepeophtheirus salmonis]